MASQGTAEDENEDDDEDDQGHARLIPRHFSWAQPGKKLSRLVRPVVNSITYSAFFRAHSRGGRTTEVGPPAG